MTSGKRISPPISSGRKNMRWSCRYKVLSQFIEYAGLARCSIRVSSQWLRHVPRYILYLFFLIGPALAWSANIEWDVAQLLTKLARTEPVRVAYTEIRHLAYLDIPLTSYGELEFHPPDSMQRSVQGKAESYLIIGDIVRIISPTASREIDLDTHPALRAFAESLRASLAGDLPRLEQYFLLELRGDEGHWQLRLRPRDATVAALIKQIELSGAGDQILRIETQETGGDRTVTKLGVSK